MDSAKQSEPLFGQTGGQHFLAGLVDHQETYGPHVIEQFVRTLKNVELAVDLGAGSGRDLGTVKRVHPTATTVAIEAGREYAKGLAGKVDRVLVSNIERDKLPFRNEEVDLILANQVLEHTKEIFWIFHEVSRCLKVGGHFIFGVPNVCSLHNRLLMLAGEQPTQHKLCSAHVRPFSRNDTSKFVNACFPGGYNLVQFRGSQFYPFPGKMARVLANAMPTLAFSIFFLLRKEKEYTEEFRTYPSRATLETNFWAGEAAVGSQY